MRELEVVKRFNWCSVLGCMVIVSILGDGNCLMYVVLIGMWVVNDCYQIFRKIVYEVFVEDVEGISKLRF